MTQPNTSPLAVYETELRDTIIGWRAAVEQIRREVADDRRVSSTAKGEVTGVRVNAIRPRWAELLAAIIDRADSTVSTLIEQSMALLPGRNNSLEGILERQACWARWTYWLGKRPDARPQAILAAAATAQDVYCLAVELPMYMSANGASEDVTGIINALVVNRLAALAGPAAVAALDLAGAAEIARTCMGPLVDQAHAEITGAAASANTLQSAVTGWAAGQAQSRRYAGLPLT